jgi:hypothetical protein
MNKRLDAGNYSNEEIVTIKIPFAIPYHVDDKDYERVNGAFQYRGEFFKLVKQKLENDTLYVVYLKDVKEKKLFDAMVDFVKLSADLPASSQQALKLLGHFIKDYTSASPLKVQANQGWQLTFNFTPQHFNLLANHLPVISPPPDFTI